MRLLLLGVMVAVALPISRAEAQTPEDGGVPATRSCALRVLDPAGVTRREGTVINILDPFRVICDDGANLRASSGTFDQVGRVVTLTGDVYFEDPTRSLTSDLAVYDMAAGVLHATGDVVFTDRVEGTTLTGPELEYFRANEQREEALVNAYGRPRLTMRRPPGAADTAAVDTAEQAETAGLVGDAGEVAAADTSGMPLTIDADQMTIVGENDLTAVGNVVIQDDEMRAVADEAEQRGTSETLELRGNASIHSQEYSLAAEVIFATIPEGSIREVEARREAHLLGEDLDVEAPQLNLIFEDNLLQRTIARSDSTIAPGVRPLATSPTFRLEADSIDASLPGQQLEVVVAIGDARGEMIDTTRAAMPPGDSLLESPGNEPLVIAADSAQGVVVDSIQGVAEGVELARGDSLPGLPLDTLPGVPLDTLASALAGAPADTLPGEPVDSLPGVPAGELGPSANEGGVDAIFASGDTVLAVSAQQLVQNDWITGDTITGYFTTVVTAPGDSVGGEDEVEVAVEEDSEGELGEAEPGGAEIPAGSDTTMVMERMVALGAARSLYHVAPEEDAPSGTRPGINFLSAARIELTFAEGRVEVAEVSGLRRGLYLEPVPPGQETEEEEPTEGAEGETTPEGELPPEGEPTPEGELPPEEELPPEGEPTPEDAAAGDASELPASEPQSGGTGE